MYLSAELAVQGVSCPRSAFLLFSEESEQNRIEQIRIKTTL